MKTIKKQIRYSVWRNVIDGDIDHHRFIVRSRLWSSVYNVVWSQVWDSVWVTIKDQYERLLNPFSEQ